MIALVSGTVAVNTGIQTPTGIPVAIRVTLTPSGFSNRAR